MSAMFGTRCQLLLVVPLLLVTAGPFPVGDIAVHAAVREASTEIRGRIRTSVHTPFGELPVTGRVKAVHACDGTYTGSVGYSVWIRLAAKLKGIGLVTAVEGRVAPSALFECVFVVRDLSGLFRIADSTISGSIHVSGDSMEVHGVVHAIGTDTYHVLMLVPMGDDRVDTAHVSLYAR